MKGRCARQPQLRSSLGWALDIVLVALLVLLQPSLPAQAQSADCVACHQTKTPTLVSEKDGHAKLKGGCKACHVATDGAAADHGKGVAKNNGLAAVQPTLCQGCHDKPKYVKSNRHTEPTKGCSGCHTTHASSNATLLKAEVPDLCYSCHAKTNFQGKFKHSPAARGDCFECHDAHSAEREVMLKLPATQTCLECHADVKDKPHVLSGFTGKGHPLGDEPRETPVQDPLRPGMHFSCVSCHDPHRGAFRRLIRADTQQPLEFCQKCHVK